MSVCRFKSDESCTSTVIAVPPVTNDPTMSIRLPSSYSFTIGRNPGRSANFDLFELGHVLSHAGMRDQGVDVLEGRCLRGLKDIRRGVSLRQIQQFGIDWSR